MKPLSILIRKARRIYDTDPIITVVAREGYSEIPDSAIHIGGTRRHDNTAIDHLGRPGALVMRARAADVAQAVGRIQAEYGPGLAIQDNTRNLTE